MTNNSNQKVETYLSIVDLLEDRLEQICQKLGFPSSELGVRGAKINEIVNAGVKPHDLPKGEAAILGLSAARGFFGVFRMKPTEDLMLVLALVGFVHGTTDLLGLDAGNFAAEMAKLQKKLGTLGGMARAAKDPRKGQLRFVRECFEDWWLKAPDRYASNTEFASDMLKKFQDGETDQKSLRSVAALARKVGRWKTQISDGTYLPVERN